VREAFDQLIDVNRILQSRGARPHRWLSVQVLCPALWGVGDVSRF
jgi:hypothetical protein